MLLQETKSITREEYFIRLYETVFPKAAAFVYKMGGSLEEAKDVFQDALIIYYEKRTSNSSVHSDESYYILGICKNLWYKNYHKNKISRPLSLITLRQDEEKEPEVSKKLMRFVELSGKKCLELLTNYYYNKSGMKELAVKFGFSGERSATVQKFKCLEKVRDAIKEKSLSKEDFYE
jgi:DNA-directed RNA polymerase specialized sigma24 family protein